MSDQKTLIKRSVYHRDIPVTKEDAERGYITVDVYFILSLFNVIHHAVGHAIKKLLLPGLRGGKSEEQDLREAVWSVNRHLEIQEQIRGKDG